MSTKIFIYLQLLSLIIMIQSQPNNDLEAEFESVETEFEHPGFICTTLEECQRKVDELELENQDLKAQLEQCNENSESNEEGGFPGEEEEEEGSDDEPSFQTKKYLVNTPGLNSYAMTLPSAGVFYLSVESTNDEYISVYLSSTCDCNSLKEAIPATGSNNCRSVSDYPSIKVSETASKKCTVYFSVEISSAPATATAWFYPLTSLPEGSPTAIDFPYGDSQRTFTQTIEAQGTPTTLYLRAFGKDAQTYTNIYVTADCVPSCFDSSYFTRFPSSINQCWYASYSGSVESYISLPLTDKCNVYYSIESSTEGKSVQATLSILQTISLKNSELITIDFPIADGYRTFYQDLAPRDTFYINAYPINPSTSASLYVTNNCTESCVESTDNTVFPTSSQYCWSPSLNYDFETTVPCRVYYSVYSSDARGAVNIKTFVYPLMKLPRDTLNTIYFPSDDSYRWFYDDILKSDVSSSAPSPPAFTIAAFATDTSVYPSIKVSSDCTKSCFESAGFTEFPNYYTYCWSESESYRVGLTGASFPCRVYYSLFSSKFGDKVKVKTSI